MIAFVSGLLLGVVIGVTVACLLALHGMDEWP